MRICVYGALTLIAVVNFGCNSDDNAAETAGGFLTLADFPVSTASKLTSEDAINNINDAKVLRDVEAEDKTTDDGESDGESDDKTEKCFTETEPKWNVINKSTLSLAANIDASECVKSASADSPFPISKFTYRFVINATCEGADFSEFEGKGIGGGKSSVDEVDISPIIEKTCTTGAKIFENFDMSMGIGEKIFVAKVATMTKDGGACEFVKSGEKETLNDCVFAEFSNFDGLVVEGKNRVNLIEANNVVSSGVDGALWFESGKFNVTLNNFTGSVSYQGASTAPVFSITDGTETKTGTLLDAFAPSLLVREEHNSLAQSLKHFKRRFTFLR